jgi:F5/8 type C domain
VTPRPHHVGALARAGLSRALVAVAAGWRFHRAHGARYGRARALCLTADVLDVRRPRDWQGRAERLYRRAARDLEAIAGQGPVDPGAARHAHRSLALASRPYRRLAVAAGALGAAAALALAVLVLVACLVSPRVRARLLPRDLAAGRPWVASSAMPPSRRSGVGPSARNDFFFQTYPSDRPWIDIDLGTPRTIRSLRVDNRRDCCWERALPLDVEVLDLDTKRWRKVAQRRAGFHVWTHEIAPVTVRHVRFRLAAVGTLHLRRIALYEW